MSSSRGNDPMVSPELYAENQEKIKIAKEYLAQFEATNEQAKHNYQAAVARAELERRIREGQEAQLLLAQLTGSGTAPSRPAIEAGPSSSRIEEVKYHAQGSASNGHLVPQRQHQSLDFYQPQSGAPTGSVAQHPYGGSFVQQPQPNTTRTMWTTNLTQTNWLHTNNPKAALPRQLVEWIPFSRPPSNRRHSERIVPGRQPTQQLQSRPSPYLFEVVQANVQRVPISKQTLRLYRAKTYDWVKNAPPFSYMKLNEVYKVVKEQDEKVAYVTLVKNDSVRKSINEFFDSAEKNAPDEGATQPVKSHQTIQLPPPSNHPPPTHVSRPTKQLPSRQQPTGHLARQNTSTPQTIQVPPPSQPPKATANSAIRNAPRSTIQLPTASQPAIVQSLSKPPGLASQQNTPLPGISQHAAVPAVPNLVKPTPSLTGPDRRASLASAPLPTRISGSTAQIPSGSSMRPAVSVAPVASSSLSRVPTISVPISASGIRATQITSTTMAAQETVMATPLAKVNLPSVTRSPRDADKKSLARDIIINLKRKHDALSSSTPEPSKKPAFDVTKFQMAVPPAIPQPPPTVSTVPPGHVAGFVATTSKPTSAQPPPVAQHPIMQHSAPSSIPIPSTPLPTQEHPPTSLSLLSNPSSGLPQATPPSMPPKIDLRNPFRSSLHVPPSQPPPSQTFSGTVGPQVKQIVDAISQKISAPPSLGPMHVSHYRTNRMPPPPAPASNRYSNVNQTVPPKAKRRKTTESQAPALPTATQKAQMPLFVVPLSQANKSEGSLKPVPEPTPEHAVIDLTFSPGPKGTLPESSNGQDKKREPLFLPSPSPELAPPPPLTPEKGSSSSQNALKGKAKEMARKRQKMQVYVDVPPPPPYLVREKERLSQKQTRFAGRTRGSSGSVLPPATKEALSFSIPRDPSTDPEENEAIRQCYSRLQESPCRWAGCEAVLNSVNALIQHLDREHKPLRTTQGATQQYFTCRWTQCGRRVNIADSHLEKHASLPLRCAYSGCDESFRAGSQLLKHVRTKHQGGNLKPSAEPRVTPIPPPKGVLPQQEVPTYNIVTTKVSSSHIPESAHTKVYGPWVLRNIAGYDQERPTRQQLQRTKKHRIAQAQERLPGGQSNSYEFLVAKSTRYSSILSEAVEMDIEDLDSAAISEAVDRGLTLWDQREGDGKPDGDDVDMERAEGLGSGYGLGGYEEVADSEPGDEEEAVETMLTGMSM